MLSKELVLAAASPCPGNVFVCQGARYTDQGYGDFTGFYDWLRTPRGLVIGVRYYPVQEVEFLCKLAAHLSYVEIDPKTRIVTLYFSEDRGVEPSLSADQDFGDNQVYKSDAGEYGISFNARGFFAHAGSIIESLSDESARKLVPIRIEQ
jgi:hypothetical protein